MEEEHSNAHPKAVIEGSLSQVSGSRHSWLLVAQIWYYKDLPFQSVNCLFMEAFYLFNLIITPHENSRTIVNMLRNDLQHSRHVIVDCLTTSYEIY